MEHNLKDNPNQNLIVMIQPETGLEKDARGSIVKTLNQLLANEAVLTQKTRVALWNVCGAGFFDVQILLYSQLEQLDEIADEVAARTRILGGIPIGSFEEFLEKTQLKELPGIIPDVRTLLADHKTIIHHLHEGATRCSEEYEDEISRGFLLDIINQHDEMVSMLRNYIENQL